MTVQVWGDVAIEDGDESAEGPSPDDPLEVLSARMPVRAVEASSGDDIRQAAEEGLVTGVHADGDCRLTTVSSEAPFADEDAEEQPDIEVVESEGLEAVVIGWSHRGSLLC